MGKIGSARRMLYTVFMCRMIFKQRFVIKTIDWETVLLAIRRTVIYTPVWRVWERWAGNLQMWPRLSHLCEVGLDAAAHGRVHVLKSRGSTPFSRSLSVHPSLSPPLFCHFPPLRPSSPPLSFPAILLFEEVPSLYDQFSYGIWRIDTLDSATPCFSYYTSKLFSDSLPWQIYIQVVQKRIYSFIFGITSVIQHRFYPFFYCYKHKFM